MCAHITPRPPPSPIPSGLRAHPGEKKTGKIIPCSAGEQGNPKIREQRGLAPQKLQPGRDGEPGLGSKTRAEAQR